MIISANDWQHYVDKLSNINKKASDLLKAWLDNNPAGDPQDLIEYAYSLSTHYGEAAAELACEMYDAIAAASGLSLAPAVPAETALIEEVAKAMNGTSVFEKAGAVGRLVKRAAADTTLKNAARDGAQFAWITKGDSCVFCATLASRGWQYMSKNATRNGHANHIHANCNCEYAIRFDNKTQIAGYDSQKFLDEYNAAGGDLNKMRRMRYDQIKDERNARRRELYKQQKVASEKRTDLIDEFIIKSVGAKAKNYDIMDLETGEYYHLVEGTYLRDKEVFAGKDSSKPYRKAPEYAAKYGGNVEDWQHVKGKGILDTEDGDRPAEVHWSQCEGIGKVELFVKRWLDES